MKGNGAQHGMGSYSRSGGQLNIGRLPKCKQLTASEAATWQSRRVGDYDELQEQTNSLAAQLADYVNRLQRDAPPVPLKGKALSQIFPKDGLPEEQPAVNIQEQTRMMATEFVKSVKLFDTLVDLLPVEEGGEDAQLQRIAELQRVNEEIGDELAMELQKTDEELLQLRSFFHEVADECFKNQGKE